MQIASDDMRIDQQGLERVLGRVRCGLYRKSMDRPRLMIYNEITLDGRIQGFSVTGDDYYRRGFRWHPDAILMGSVTALNFGPVESADEQAQIFPAPETLPLPLGFDELVYEPRPLLIVPDSGGRVRNWLHALAQPWYRSILVLVADSSPDEYLAYLRRRGIEHLSVGMNRVDLVAGLEIVAAELGVRSVRTDSGGDLNGALLALGLVDEIALIGSRPAEWWSFSTPCRSVFLIMPQ